MRTHFQSDEEIPPCAWQLFPELKQKLDRIIELEDKLGSALSSRKRISFAINSEPELKTKILRIHLRHQFFPSTALDRAHFLITVEGHLLDKSVARTMPFGNFLDKIRIQLDKRFHPVNNIYEWSAESFPEGVKGHCFRVKAYGDKPFPIKVFLYRSNDIRPRYELSPLLREILPSMQMDPTEEQVLLALWAHLSTNGMLEGRDRRQIKCSMELKNLFGVESLSLSSLRQKIADHLTVCKPIQVEYNVATTSALLTSSFGPNAVAKAGGKAFDIEVDVRDPYAFDLLESINDISRNQREMMETISQMEQRASFLAGSIIECSNSIFAGLKCLQNDPLALQGGSSSSSSLTSRAGTSGTDSMTTRISSPADPLLCTAAGESRSYPLRPSVPSELLQRASDPFSLISRRSVPASSRTKRILRPQRGSNPPIDARHTKSVVSAEGEEVESKRDDIDPSLITTTNVTAMVVVEVNSYSVTATATATATASSSGRVSGAMDVTTASADEEEDTAISPVVETVASTDGNKAEHVVKSHPALKVEDEVKVKVEDEDEGGDAGERMDIEDEKGSEERPRNMDDVIHSAEEMKKGDFVLAVVKTETKLLPVKEEMEEKVELEKGSESSSLLLNNENGNEIENLEIATSETAIETAIDIGLVKEEGIVDLVAIKGEIKEESPKESEKEDVKQILKEDGKEEEVQEKPIIPSAASTLPIPVPVPEPHRHAALQPTTLPRAPDSLSAIHGLRGFLDVGSDALFASSEPWVLATASLLAKRKLARN